MRLKNISPSLICLLPSLLIIPCGYQFISESHLGGLNIIVDFITGAIKPSLEALVIKNSFNSLLITLSTAFTAWSISITIGLFLGLISSSLFWLNLNFKNTKDFSFLIKKIFALPRSIHELLWGLTLQAIFGLNPLVAILALSIPYSFLFARVVCNQIDNIDKKSLISLRYAGTKPITAFITSIYPKIKPILINHAGYRLECALRGATVLGIFGLGGIGTELQLTLKSLQFNEMWTSLWMLWGVMFFLEKLIIWYKKIQSFSPRKLNLTTFCITFIVFIVGIVKILSFVFYRDLYNLHLPEIYEFKIALTSLPLIELTTSTILLTVFALAIATGLPTISLLISQNKIWNNLLSILWSFLRLTSPTLIALLLLMCSNPSFSVAALSLGAHNMGVMGRVLKEGIETQNRNIYQSFKASGASNRISWLYGMLGLESKSYLAYAAYRSEIILRETALVGVVGGIGLGWQLQESLSSFAWAEVIVLIIIYSIITIIAESIFNKSTLLSGEYRITFNNH